MRLRDRGAPGRFECVMLAPALAVARLDDTGTDQAFGLKTFEGRVDRAERDAAFAGIEKGVRERLWSYPTARMSRPPDLRALEN